MALVITLLLVLKPGLRRISTMTSLLTEAPPSQLPVPVEGVAPREIADTWGAPRGANRRHEGIDIFAPRGRAVRSSTRGIIWKVGEDNLGGNVVVVMGPGGCWHYYAHLDSFAEIEPGDVVREGSVLGYVGDTGNARGTPHHLHYGVYGFWGGARNPYPMLAGRANELRATRPPPQENRPKPKLRSRAPVS
jgi:murein DD-endopeptidase MepM/ murein hydrolase activator NlpD